MGRVIFTSNNAPWLTYGNHSGSAGGLREGKATNFEGGVWVPMIARWPGWIKAGTASTTVAGLYDVLPTLMDIVQGSGPVQVIDGRGFANELMAAGKEQPQEEPKFYFSIHELQAVRVGKWKLHVPHTYRSVSEPGQDGARGKEESKAIELALFDQDSDPQEQVNVAAQNPETVKELSAKIGAFSQNLEGGKRKPATQQKIDRLCKKSFFSSSSFL